jgi:D-serine deaminase-like pyridoxal phosphate-dependent protein
VLGEPGIATPALVVCDEQARCNVRAFASAAESFGVRWRPHFKGHKALPLLAAQAAAGAAGVELAKITEIQRLAAAGTDLDVVLAWAWTSPVVWDCAARLAAEGLGLAVDIDSDDLVDGYEAAAARHHAVLGVRVQVDAGLRGADPSLVPDLCRRVAAAPHLRLDALTCYRSTYLRSFERDDRPFDVLGREEGELLARLAAAVADEVGPLALVCGSTSTAFGAAAVEGVTEVVTGNGALRDEGLARMGVIDPSTIALGVVTTVLAVEGDAVVVDAGAAALGQGLTYPGLGPQRASSDDGGLSISDVDEAAGRGPWRGATPPRSGDRLVLLPTSASSVVADPGTTIVVAGDGTVVDAWERLATATPTMDVEIAMADAWARR